MDNRILRHPFFPPLLISMVSLLGICFIFGFSSFHGQVEPPPPTQTVTPFRYTLLATETITPTHDVRIFSPTGIPLSPTTVPVLVTTEATSDSSGSSPTVTAEQSWIPTEELFTPMITITPAPIFTQAPSMSVGTYDGADPHIIQTGSWNDQRNVNDAFEETLLISRKVGNSVAFSFVGRNMALGYNNTQNAGSLTVNIDGVPVSVTQLVGNIWISQELENGTHFVFLTHETGDAVNLDYIDIFE